MHNDDWAIRSVSAVVLGLAGAAAGVTAALAGCGSSTATPAVGSSSAPPNGASVCQLITDADAARLLGRAGAAGVESSDAPLGGQKCTWKVASGTDNVTILLYRGDSASSAISVSNQNLHPSPLAGVGEEAYSTGSGEVWGRKGTVAVFVEVFSLGASNDRPGTEATLKNLLASALDKG